MSEKEKVDIYLVAGFNGVGKTTYINEFLKNLTGTVAVIQNELGEVELQFEAGESQCVMGGCVCCSLQAELVGVLMQYAIFEKMNNIVVELPSTAKLSSVIELCRTLEKKRNGNFDIHTVDIIDAGRFGSHLRNFGEFYTDQLQYADSVILTRMDGLAEKKQEFLEEKLQELAANATRTVR